MILDAVCKALYESFGDKCRIYTEKTEQKFTRPCFFVESAESSTELFRNNRYYNRDNILVTYYPVYKDKNKDMEKTSEKLALCLETIYPDGFPMRTESCKIVFDKDFMRAYPTFGYFTIKVQKEEDTELMWEYTLNFKE